DKSSPADGKPVMPPGFPNPMTRDVCFAWCQSIHLPGASSFHFLDDSLVTANKSSLSWADVQVVGEICEDLSEDYEKGFQRLRIHAEMTFKIQPTRRFLRAFYIRLPSNIVELWIFDRAG
ncbi:hypothetical protein MMC31_004598, partial [Peltigera leucophlebia]|nr:hypothetical protein [Peltigera leucophlebia]